MTQPTDPPRSRLAWMALVAGIATWAAPGSLDAAVVVLANRTEQEVKFRLGPVWGQTKDYALAPGKMLPVQVPDSVEVTYQGSEEEVTRAVDPNTLHEFALKDGKLVLEQVRFSQSGTRWWYSASQTGPPPPVVVPVKILADDEEAAEGGDWQARLRGLLAAASRAIEPVCGVRFEVAGAQLWDSDDEEADFARLEARFREQVMPEPGWLAVGVTRQFRISEEHPLRHRSPGPLFTHLVLPDVQEGFSDADQLALLTHDLGHFLGASHSAEETSVMRSPVPQEDKQPERRPAGTEFDALNALVMNVVADEIRLGEVRSPDRFERGTVAYLRAIYGEMARRVRKDRQPGHFAAMLGRAAFRGPRYTGEWTDGSRRTGDEVGPWNQKESAPSLAGKPLFSGGSSIRWFADNSIEPADPPRAMIELVGGDRLPGRVTGLSDGDESPLERLPSHFVVVPYARLDWPGEPRPQIRVRSGWVRRIVWKRVTDRYQPQTLLFVDGRKLDFRSARVTETSVQLLREDGIREVPLADVAELHLPRHDPWEAYFEQLAELSPDGTAGLVEIETSDGLRVTSSSDRFQANAYGSPEDSAKWYHLVQPAWSLDAFWLRHREVRLRRFFPPNEVRLSRIEPVQVRQQSDLGGDWPWRVDRNAEGGPLQSGGLEHAWGFGIHAANEMQFPLPNFARALQTRLGLDALAGDGGCVEASILLGSAAGKPLYASGPIVGSAKVLSTGRLALDTPSQSSGRLVLRVDAAHDRRPEGADPLDVRDACDWIEPILELDLGQLRGEIARLAPRRIPAWQDWQVTTGDQESARLANYWDQTDSHRPTFRLMARADGPPLRLSRKLTIRPDRYRLLLAVSRPPSSPASTIEVQVDGQKVAELEVPVRSGREAPEPLAVSLVEHEGRQVTVDLIQQAQEPGALVEWRSITLAGPT
jgi:hypothetical protein